jgi:RimJ/RimL family protein N-acetyltransferase
MRHTLIVETDRLLSEVPILEDSDFLYELNSHPDVVRYTGEQPWSMQEVLDFLTDNPGYEQYGWGRYMVLRKEDGEPIGLCGFRKYDDRDDRFISYRFLPEYWGNGYATEICKELLRYGFENLGFTEIYAHVHPGNPASVRVAEKIGMKKQKTFTWAGEEWWEMKSVSI